MEVERNWRVAVVGAGPAGLYAAEALVKRGARVDVFERLFAPQGLVRYGVAPDHQKIKRTAAVFDRILARPEVRLFGNVNVGHDLSIDDLRGHYDQVLVAMGSSGSRRLGIPGEDLRGSLSAPEFVGWYNGHPDFIDLDPPLQHRAAVVVGMGNVAIDVARILLRERDVLAQTDISRAALSALEQSAIEEVTLLARRGPDEAAFDVKEVRELLQLTGVQVGARGYARRVETDKGELIAQLPKADLSLRAPRIVFRFCASPRELIGEAGHLVQIRIEDNDLVESAARVRAVGSGRTEVQDVGLCIRAIGYRGVPLPGLPFEELSGTVPNDRGAVLTHPGGERVRQLYVTGWIKRGATGLIGTNKACAHETVETMENSLRHVGPAHDPQGIDRLLEQRGVRVIDWPTWQLLDRWERSEGEKHGAVRFKLTRAEEALDLARRLAAV